MIDHDRLFKELLKTFFLDFLDLFAPEMAALIDAESVEFLDKEVFTDAVTGDRYEADLVVKVRLRGETGRRAPNSRTFTGSHSRTARCCALNTRRFNSIA
jgi:hypothetical protein